MNPIYNPYSPGAGTRPLALTGRGNLRDALKISMARIKLRKPAKSVLLLGLRGVGKTVLLDQILLDAEELGIHTVRMEATEKQSLPAMLAPALRIELLRLSRLAKAKDLAWRALRALAGFAKALKV